MPQSFIPNAPAGFKSFVGNSTLGSARGSIQIDTSGLEAAKSVASAVGKDIKKALDPIDQSAKKAKDSTQSLASTMGQLGRAVGILGGVAGAVQLGRFALDADATATAYKRQSVAALSLAGSQTKLNELLATYDRATGGAVDKAQALADVVKLQATGFADSAEELEKFTTAARGISVATGRDQDYVISQLQLAIANKSTLRLDQLGLGVSEVAAKVKELKAANTGLTEEQIYQNAVLGIATTKFGALAKSTVAQATGAEKAAKAWKDFRLEFGQAFGPAIGGAMSGAADQIKGISDLIKGATDDAKEAAKAFSDMRGPGARSTASSILNYDPTKDQGLKDWLSDMFTAQMAPSVRTKTKIRGDISEAEFARNQIVSTRADMVNRGASQTELARQDDMLKQVNAQLAQFKRELTLGSHQPFASRMDLTSLPSGGGASAPGVAGGLTIDQLSAIHDWARGVKQIEREANTSRLEATRQFGQQYASAVHEYEQGIARDAQDFAISRRRQAADLAENIASIQANSTKQAAQWAEDLAKSIAKATGDTNERIAKIQADSNKRIAEIDDDYRRSREKAARDHNDTLMEAAGNLDAKAVYQEQKRYAEQSKDAKDAHDTAIKKERDGQAERIAEEQASLAERIQQDKEANAERLADAAQADAQRIQDAKDALAKQQAQEDEDRALRLQRMAEDQAEQLAQMGAAQAERMAQIDAQEAEQKAAADDAFNAQLEEAGLHNEHWLETQKAFEDEALKRARAFWKAQLEMMPKAQGPQQGPNFIPDDLFPAFASGGPVHSTGLAKVHAGEWVVPTAAVNRAGGFAAMAQMQRGGRSVNIGDISFAIYPLPGMDANDIANAVDSRLHSILEGMS